MSSVTTIQHDVINTNQNNWQENEIEGIQMETEEIQLLLLENNIILCIDNPKASYKKITGKHISNVSGRREIKINYISND